MKKTFKKSKTHVSIEQFGSRCPACPCAHYGEKYTEAINDTSNITGYLTPWSNPEETI